VGLFVRIGIGMREGKRVYRMAQVAGVEKGNRTYTLGKKPTQQLLYLKHGSDEKPFSMEYVSNQNITPTELDKWLAAMKQDSLPIITLDEIREKRAALRKADTYVYTDEDIDKIVSEKNKLRQKPVNLAAAKVALLQRKKVAKNNNNLEELEKIKEELKQLKEWRREEKEKTGKLKIVETLNKKNKEKNRIKEHTMQKHAGMGPKELDPFSRRPTAPRTIAMFQRNKVEPEQSTSGSNAETETGIPVISTSDSTGPALTEHTAGSRGLSAPSGAPAAPAMAVSTSGGSESASGLPETPAVLTPGTSDTNGHGHGTPWAGSKDEAHRMRRTSLEAHTILSAHDNLDLAIDLDLNESAKDQGDEGIGSVSSANLESQRKRPSSSKGIEGLGGSKRKVGAQKSVKTLSLNDYKRRRGLI